MTGNNLGLCLKQLPSFASLIIYNINKLQVILDEFEII